MKKAYPFLLSVAVIVCCLAVYICSLHIGNGVYLNVRNISDAEQMQGNDSGEADRIELYSGETVNINTADAKRLALLPEIGEGLAEKIIEYREKNGCFESIEDIMKVDGIGESRFDAIGGLITTGELCDENSGS